MSAELFLADMAYLCYFITIGRWIIMNLKDPYSGNQPYCFVSYAHSDWDRVFPYICQLQELGFRIWFDAGITPEPENKPAILEKINNCHCFIAFVSAAYLCSPFADAEREYAYHTNKTVILAYLDYVEPIHVFAANLDSTYAFFRPDCLSDEAFISEISKSCVFSPCSDNASEIICASEKLYKAGKEYFDEYVLDLAISYFRIAAEMKHPAAQYFMGVNFSTLNRFIRRSMRSAAKWYVLAADQGHAGAIYNLSILYLRGSGLEKDLHMAAELLRKAVAFGAPRADNMLKHCLDLLEDSDDSPI